MAVLRQTAARHHAESCVLKRLFKEGSLGFTVMLENARRFIPTSTHSQHVQLACCHHDPVVQVLPDHANFVKSRITQRCQMDLYQGTRGTRFGAEATRTFREERLHPWLTESFRIGCVFINRDDSRYADMRRSKRL